MKKLHKTTAALKQYAHVNKKAFDQYQNFTQQRDEHLARRAELDTSAESIQELIETLDQRKDEAHNAAPRPERQPVAASINRRSDPAERFAELLDSGDSLRKPLQDRAPSRFLYRRSDAFEHLEKSLPVSSTCQSFELCTQCLMQIHTSSSFAPKEGRGTDLSRRLSDVCCSCSDSGDQANATLP